MKTSPIKTLVVGGGLISRFHEQAIRASGRLAFAGRVSFRSGEWKAALAEPGLGMAVVATASGAHDEVVFEAARLRVPVLVEKPLAITSARIDAMAAACAATDTPLGCICQTRWTPAFQSALSAVRQGRLGRITFVRVDVPWWRDDSYYTESSWHGTWAMDGGGALMNQSIHMVDWLTALMPPVAEVKGFAATLAHPMEAEDTVSAALRFEGGALGQIYATTASFPGRSKKLEITGTKGTLEVGNAIGHGSNRPDALPCEQHRLAIESFANALRGGAPYPIDGAEARKSVALIERIYRSGEDVVR